MKYHMPPAGGDSATQLLAIIIPIIPIVAVILILWVLHWDGLELSSDLYPFPTLANVVPWVIGTLSHTPTATSAWDPPLRDSSSMTTKSVLPVTDTLTQQPDHITLGIFTIQNQTHTFPRRGILNLTLAHTSSVQIQKIHSTPACFMGYSTTQYLEIRWHLI